jgi:galactonate dehydratase
MPDVKHCGGVREAVRIAGEMRARGVRVSPHSPTGPVCQLGSAHACAVMNDPLPLEYAWGEVPWRAEMLLPSERIRDGALHLPSKPGLGARLNAELVERHGRQWQVE